MFNAKHFLRQCLLAVALAAGAVTASAGPTSFHVDVNTGSLSGNGFLDFLFSTGVAALPATATLSNFSAGFGAIDASSGAYTVGAGDSLILANGGDYNDIFRNVTLGGILSFDLGFSGPFFDTAGSEGSNFSVALFDQNGDVVGGNFGIAIFELAATSPATIGISTNSDFATVAARSAVPEPSDWALMLTGLALIGGLTRRARR